MIGPRGKKVISDLVHNKTRSALVILSMATGVFAVGLVAGSHRTLTETLVQGYMRSSPAMATLFFLEPFEVDLHETVRNFRGVREAQGRRNLQVRMLGDTDDDSKPLTLVGVPDFRDVRINRFRVESGRVPPPQDVVLVERSALKAANWKVGDRFQVETPQRKRRWLTVGGEVVDVNAPSANFTGQLQGYVVLDTIEALGEEPRPDVMLLQLDLDKPTRDEVRNQVRSIRNRLDGSGYNVVWSWVPPPGQHPAADPLTTLLTVLAVMGLLVLFLSGFLLVNTIGALLTQQTRQIGVMKAVGATTGQIFGLYITLVVVYCTLSVALAVPLGFWAAREACAYVAGLLNLELEPFVVPPEILAAEIALGFLVPLLAAVVPVLRAARITVREAVAFYGLSGGGFGGAWVDRMVARIRFLTRPALLSLRNTFRRKGRLFLTLATLSMGGAIFMGVYSVRASLLETLDAAMQYWNYDAEAEFTRPYRADQVINEALRVPGVVRAESWGFSGAQIVDDWNGKKETRVFFIAPPADTDMLRPTLVDGRWLRNDDTTHVVINTEVLKQEPDIKVGDVLRIRIGLHKTEWKVVGIVQGVLSGAFVYANRPHFGYVSGEAGRASSLQIVTDGHDEATHKRVVRALEERFKLLGIQVNNVSAASEWKGRARKQFDVIISFLLVMAVLMAFVGGLALMGTMGINVLERVREVGVIRAVGAGTSSVLSIFILEGVTIGLISWAQGVILSLPVAWALGHQVGMMFTRAPLRFSPSVEGMAAWLVLILALSALASVAPAWRAARLRVREVLATE
ncbi:MAG: ABC transporter permease [Deltaproteobacteria bacterium]|nr:ABC transporter permease [Deltaproteobacteria bacterium]